eukprot:363403-Chlamydomonas_euryale.AAC.18
MLLDRILQLARRKSPGAKASFNAGCSLQATCRKPSHELHWGQPHNPDKAIPEDCSRSLANDALRGCLASDLKLLRELGRNGQRGRRTDTMSQECLTRACGRRDYRNNVDNDGSSLMHGCMQLSLHVARRLGSWQSAQRPATVYGHVARRAPRASAMSEWLALCSHTHALIVATMPLWQLRFEVEVACAELSRVEQAACTDARYRRRHPD